MAATQGFLPSSTVAHLAGSRAPRVALTALALGALVATLAWLGSVAGASPVQTSAPAFPAYYGSGSNAGASTYDSLYPVAQVGVVASARVVPDVTVAWGRTYAGDWARYAKEHGIPYDKQTGGPALEVKLFTAADQHLLAAWKRTHQGGWAQFAEEHGIPHDGQSRGTVSSSGIPAAAGSTSVVSPGSQRTRGD